MSKPQEVIVTNCVKVCPPRVFLRTRYNYNQNEATLQAGLKCLDPSLAVQAQKEEADINTIVKRFRLTGQLPSSVRLPQNGDFSEIGTYQECLNAVIEAQNAFNAYPADIRARFNNDPQEFIDFFNDEKNRAEGEKLGLVIPRKTADGSEDLRSSAVGSKPGKTTAEPVEK